MIEYYCIAKGFKQLLPVKNYLFPSVWKKAHAKVRHLQTLVF